LAAGIFKARAARLPKAFDGFGVKNVHSCADQSHDRLSDSDTRAR
jgi:hypothetical protein